MSHGNVVTSLWDLRVAPTVDSQQKARVLNHTGARKLINPANNLNELGSRFFPNQASRLDTAHD